MSFHIYQETSVLDETHLAGLEKVIGDFVQADTPLALEFVMVSAEEIQTLNRETRQIDKVTDVLSYPTLEDIKGKKIEGKNYPYDIDENGCLLIGSVAICEEKARAQAEEFGHSYERELHYLLVHGVLHCLGYDHMTDEDKAEMREKEEYILKNLGITRE